jgi:hypothetical protein
LKSPWAANTDSIKTQGANLIILIIIHPIPQGESKGAYDKYNCNYKNNYFYVQNTASFLILEFLKK